MDEGIKLREIYRIIFSMKEEIKQMNVQLRALRKEVKGEKVSGTEG